MSIQVSIASKLPQEIIDTIIDHCQSSTKDLKTCSLIGRKWVPRSRRHLFRFLRLKASQSRDVFEEAIATLRPVLPLIRELSLDSSESTTPFQLTEATFEKIQCSFNRVDQLSFKGVRLIYNPLNDVDNRRHDSPLPILRELTLSDVCFFDVSTMLSFLHNPFFSQLRFLSIDSISFSSTVPIHFLPPGSLQVLSPTSHRAKLEELSVGSVRTSVLRVLFGSHSPLDFCTTMKRVSLFSRIPGQSADVSLENHDMWASVTHLSFSAWRSNITLFPPNITHLTMTYKSLNRQATDSRLSHLSTTSPKIQSLRLVFYWPLRTDSDKLNTIMSDFDEDLASISTSLTDIQHIQVRFVLKTEHSGGFCLLERLNAMFLRTDEAISLRNELDVIVVEEEEGKRGVVMQVEVREISDAEYRADLRGGFGFEY